MSTEVRQITATEHSAWAQTLNRGFLRAEPVTPGDVALRAAAGELGRVQGAFDSETGGCVGTFRSFTQELTVPGGATVTASAVTNVSVLPTHRRQGLLTRMMAAEFAAATARGDVLSTLIAAEYPIYGRYGYGPAVYVAEWRSTYRAPAWTRTGPHPPAAASSWWTWPRSGGSVRPCTSGSG